MTTELLSATKIGVSVNAAKKAFVGTAVEAPAAELVSKWKGIVADEAEERSKRPSKEVNYNEEKVESAGTSSSQAVSSSDDPARMMKLDKIYKQIGEGPIPTRNAHGEYCFSDYPDFRPNLSPKEVLQMGSFGGTYSVPSRVGALG